MNMPNERNLHKRSAELIANLPPESGPGEPPIRSILEDLHLYQAELETQNQELLEAQQKLDESRRKFVQLFDLAPVGFVRVTHEGIILDINLRAAELLGAVRQHIQPGKSPIIGLFDGACHRDFFELLRLARETLVTQETVLKTAERGKPGRHLGVLASSLTEDDHVFCLLCLVDVTARHWAEEEVARNTLKILEQNADLARFNKLAVGRELRMVELKKEVNELCHRVQEPVRYSIEQA